MYLSDIQRVSSDLVDLQDSEIDSDVCHVEVLDVCECLKKALGVWPARLWLALFPVVCNEHMRIP